MTNEELDEILTSLNANMETASVMRHLRAENEKLREALIGLYKPVFENPVEVGSNLDLALRAAAAAIRESGDE